MARTLEGGAVMWPYTDDESNYLSLPVKEEPKVWDKSGWYWERYKNKCLNEIAPLADHSKNQEPFTEEEADYVRFAA